MLHKTIIILLTIFLISSCTDPATESKNKDTALSASKDSEEVFVTTLQKHLDAVSNRDLKTLESTLSPEGNMLLILPGTEMTASVEEFLDYHRAWFKDDMWTFETKILHTEIGDQMGLAITEVVYREPERDGVPYFNRMVVSYDLKKIGGQWYIVKDHASSVEKSTDKK